MPLLSFHNDKAIKDKYVARVKAHAEADEFVHGKYWENGKGCAVGCTIHSNQHNAYETELGLPEWLARLEDTIFEGLSNGEAKKFAVDFLLAIPIGKNLEPVKWKFCAFVLNENIERVLLLKIEDKLKQQVVEAIQGVLTLHEKAAKTGKWDESAWSAARAAGSAAESAARAAESAARAAWSAAESAARAAESAAESAARAAWSAAESAARAAESAAESAARAAAWSAARAAWSAAESAARAAESAARAAWSAAESAARAAESAAESAARAAWSAAESAARAAESAAESAARAAAWSAARAAWSAAESAARAAESAAESAARAAWSAEYKKYAKELLRLLKSSH